LERPGTVAIIGVGLIGGSIGMALRSKGMAGRVIGVGRDATRLEVARQLGAVDEIETNLGRGVAEADVAVVCTPVTRIVEDCMEAARLGPTGILVTDAGSTKARIVSGVESDLRGRDCFVGAHPIAGSERQGAGSGRADLFEGRCCVLTPTDRTPPDRLDRARLFWSGLGCQIVEVDPIDHDDRLALTSHLPHVVAAALAGSVPVEMLRLAAGAYRDGTRVASADAALWSGIFLENRSSVLNAIEEFGSRIDQFCQALRSGDEASLIAWWEEGRSRRNCFAERSRSNDSLPV